MASVAAWSLAKRLIMRPRGLHQKKLEGALRILRSMERCSELLKEKRAEITNKAEMMLTVIVPRERAT